MNLDIYGLAFGYVGQTVFLFVALWIMLKLQKLEFRFTSLLVSAMVSSALDHVPYVGWELSAVVLVLCITRVIGSRTFTDAIFTTSIAFAISFCFNLFVLGALMGDLRHFTEVRARTRTAAVSTNVVESTNKPVEQPNMVVSFLEKAVVRAFAKGPTQTAKPTPSNTVAQPGAGKSVEVATATETPASRAASNAKATAVAKNFKIKGFSRGAVQTLAMIGNGQNTYDVGQGDNFQMQTGAGKAQVTCVSVDESTVVLDVEGVQVLLRHKSAE